MSNINEEGKKYTDKQLFLDVVSENFKDNNEHFITAKRLRKITKDIIETFWPSNQKNIYTLNGFFISGKFIKMTDDGSVILVFRPDGNIGEEINKLSGKTLIGAGGVFSSSIKCNSIVDYAGTKCLKINETGYEENDKGYLYYFESSNLEWSINSSNRADITLTVNDNVDIINIDLIQYGTLYTTVYNGNTTLVTPTQYVSSVVLKNDSKINGKEIKIVNNNPRVVNFLPCKNTDYCFNSIYHVTSELKDKLPENSIEEPYFINLMYWNKKWYADGNHIK